LGYISFYLALNLYEDIGGISTIYQNSLDYSVLISNSKVDGVKVVTNILSSNVIANSCILLFVNLFSVQYIKYKIIHGNWNILFIEKIFGKRFYYYFMKIYSFGGKTILIWIYFCLFLLMISCVMSVFIRLFLIEYLDTVTELYEKLKNKFKIIEGES